MYILYPILFNAVQTRIERSKFYIRTLKQEKRGSSHFHLSETNRLHRISPLQFLKSLLFVNTDVRSLLNERALFTE